MRRAVLVFVLARFALVGLASPARTASSAGTMKGKVVDSRLFEPIPGICVQADLVEGSTGPYPTVGPPTRRPPRTRARTEFPTWCRGSTS